MTSLDDILSLYDYLLPPERIAQDPADPRDSARLMVYDRKKGTVEEGVFRDIGAFLPPRSLLVLNETRVIPAKLSAVRETGGKVSLLILGQESGRVRAWSNRTLKPGETLWLDADEGLRVHSQAGKEWMLSPTFPLTELTSKLEHFGTAPLPPYIKHSTLSREEVKREYQSVFAHHPGSIAAPTASLHFTDRLLSKLKKSGIDLAYVTLHVHLGTFAPLTDDQWSKGALHREEYHIPPQTIREIAAAKAAGRPVIAVGTTVVRTLESAADASGAIVHSSGQTNLFIREGYKFRVVGGLITNFHVPRSSLLMLVSALVGRGKLMELYREAIARRFRFFSFGDAMLVK